MGTNTAAAPLSPASPPPAPAATRQADIARLRTEHARALATPLMSEGSISPHQLSRMSKRQHASWSALAQERMQVEATIRMLSRSDEEIERDQRALMARVESGRLMQIDALLDISKRVGVSKKTGKMRPTYAAQIEALKAERAALVGGVL